MMAASRLEQVILSAGFDENDVDMATSGLCATFALSVTTALPGVGMGIVCCANTDGTPVICDDGEPLWRHVVALDGDVMLDIHGSTELDDLIETYCWGPPTHGRGCVVPIARRDLIALAHSDSKSFDARYFARWAGMLQSSPPGPIPSPRQ